MDTNVEPEMKVEPAKAGCGAIVHVDRSMLSHPSVAKRCMELIETYGVIVFPKVALNDEEQLAFTDALGKREDFTKSAPGGGDTGVYTITLDKAVNAEPEYVLGTFFYHMDGMPMEGIPPPKASVLSCRKTSAKGGQTQFANTFAAYEALPEAEKAELEKLTVVHSLLAGVREVMTNIENISPTRRARKAERPLVWTHKSGRKSLLIGYTADYVVGMPKAEGRALLMRLLEWAGQPAFSYSHEWSVGDLVVWDNCGALHRVIPYDAESGRSMRRTSVAGS